MKPKRWQQAILALRRWRSVLPGGLAAMASLAAAQAWAETGDAAVVESTRKGSLAVTLGYLLVVVVIAVGVAVVCRASSREQTSDGLRRDGEGPAPGEYWK